MNDRLPAPELMFVRVRTPGGPFAPGDRLAIAFNDPDVGRVAGDEPAVRAATPASSPPIPEAVFVEVTAGAEPYAAGDVLTLWFVDPHFARIVSTPGGAPRDDGARPTPAHAPVVRALERATDGVLAGVRLNWSSERARRFVQVVDRLFTVDRLGWYRHTLAMRLLVPDEIVCGDSAIDAAAAAYLQTARDTAVETLGGPLLAAFMPNFSVTPEWLEALDAPATARSFAQLRSTLAATASARTGSIDLAPEPTTTVGTIDLDELTATSDLSLDAILPVFIPSRSLFPALTERLTGYRQSLIALFGATAHSARPVRLTQMAEPCHSLDDRLWQLVGAVGESFGGLASA
jgi:hypothetical protein